MDPVEMERLRQNIQEIRKSGMRVIFDDFGVGFSSFHDLQSCSIDGLKLDKELVDHMQTEKGKIILNALVEIGHRMGLKMCIRDRSITDAVYEIGGIEYFNIVMQNDEISG